LVPAALNRTNLELKLTEPFRVAIPIRPLNRTNLELKRSFAKAKETSCLTLNRTNLELKQLILIIAVFDLQLSIAPIWN
tara:strand:+ start:2490 stop:2726 length:237 start_codon:yes stop_codon:yes gene_type:complete